MKITKWYHFFTKNKVDEMSPISISDMYLPHYMYMRVYCKVGSERIGYRNAALNPINVPLYTILMYSTFGIGK